MINNIIFLICLILIVTLIVVIPVDLALSQESSSSVSSVSTRGHFNLDTGELRSDYTINEYNAINVPGLQVGNCPDESVIYVHGFFRSEDQAEEEADRINLVLRDKNYLISVINQVHMGI